ncbi:MAG: LTA synthase family protein [Bacilli bacterium]|nr:LTA synthase family protein [Bacilli bacterium]
MKKLISIFSWFIIIIYMELIIKISLFGGNIFDNFIYVLLFSLASACFCYFITNLFNEKLNKIISYIIIIFLIIIFVSQLIYYKTYLSIFSVFSMTKADQIFEYIDTIIKIIFRNWLPIILLILPLVLFIIFNKKVIYYKSSNIIGKIILTLTIIFLHVISLLCLNINNNDIYSAKKLYYSIHSPTLSTNKLGLLTTMRLDLKRLVFGFKGDTKLNIEKEKNNVKETTKKIEYNVMNIDFNTLINTETDTIVKQMHEYFESVQPTSKNDYTGLFKGKNLITIIAESFDPIAIDPVLTPTLYKLSTEGFQFTNFYTPIFPVSTSDGEYITITSLIPKEGVWSEYRSSSNYFPFVLGNLFKSIGYKTTAYHNNTYTYYYRQLAYPNYGYDYYACGRGLNINCNIWPESDLDMVNATYEQYMNNSPFLTYYLTVSGHLRYNKYNSMSLKNWAAVDSLNYTIPVKAYLAANIELDKAVEQLIAALTAKGILEDTVISISGDHYPYGLTLDEINEKSSYIRDDKFTKYKMSFLLWNSETKTKVINKLGSSMDVLPTLLNLFGVEYDSRLLMGRDLLSDSEPIVIFSNRSFITSKGKYDSLTNKFYDNSGVEVSMDQTYLKEIKNIIYNRFYMSTKILEKDYYKKIFK